MIDRSAIANAWRGRISGCQLGKPVESLSMDHGREGLTNYLTRMAALPLRDYVPYDGSKLIFRASCRGEMTRSEADDDINYSILSLMMLERHGRDLTTADVARSWLRFLPIGATFTAERAAYVTLANNTEPAFAFGGKESFDLAECSDNEFNDWIGAQIRTDVYGWVCSGNPAEAARLAAVDASLSHRGAGVHGAQFVAACGAAIPVANSLEDAVNAAVAQLPGTSAAVAAVSFGKGLVGRDDAVDRLHAEYGHLSPVHTLNNLALVVWALLDNPSDFGAAIGEAVAAGWDTDCNGATVGGLWGMTGQQVPEAWTDPWRDTVVASLAGVAELTVADLVDRTMAVAESMPLSC